MIQDNGRWVFGFWPDMQYGTVSDKYEDFVEYKNDIDKEKVIRHIESLDWACGFHDSTDIFTGEKFRKGIYDDGVFTFPVDFFRYYKTQDIGIPYEYEAYLKTILD